MSNLRAELVNAIYDYSKEELDVVDMLMIAKSSEEVLLARLINILEWYANEHNNQQ